MLCLEHKIYDRPSDSDANTYSDTYSDANTDTDTHAYSDSDSDSDTDTDTDTDIDIDIDMGGGSTPHGTNSILFHGDLATIGLRGIHCFAFPSIGKIICPLGEVS